MSKPESYRIVVNGRLSDRFAAAFAGMAIEAGEGRTAIVGVVDDQSHLFGILERIRSLGLELVRVETLCR
ncbi:MAG TPA: hypothetical protein VGH82_02640 [Gaiellaceae bacterium]|jgi:acetyl-CoA acetyltransferase